MEVRIRKAEARDLPKVMEIERCSFPSSWPERLLRSYLGEAGFMVGEKDGEVVSYILVGLRVPSLFSRLERRTRLLFSAGSGIDPNPRVGHVMNLAVDPPHRSRGLGKEILQAGLDYLGRLGAGRVELEVRVQNKEAICLYRKFGFQIERVIHRYYMNGDDAYFMATSLCANP